MKKTVYIEKNILKDIKLGKMNKMNKSKELSSLKKLESKGKTIKVKGGSFK